MELPGNTNKLLSSSNLIAQTLKNLIDDSPLSLNIHCISTLVFLFKARKTSEGKSSMCAGLSSGDIFLFTVVERKNASLISFLVDNDT